VGIVGDTGMAEGFFDRSMMFLVRIDLLLRFEGVDGRR